MAYIDHDSVTATDTAKTIVNLTVPPNATGAELQAGAEPIRYTMDGNATAAPTVGMVLEPTMPPKEFLLEDIRNISFIREGGTNGELQIHWFGGRDI